MNCGIIIGLILWGIIFLFLAKVYYNKFVKKILKCPVCKKKESYNKPLEFGEFETCSCGYQFIPSGMVAFLPLIDKLKPKEKYDL